MAQDPQPIQISMSQINIFVVQTSGVVALGPEEAKAPLRKCFRKIRHFLFFVGKSQKLIDLIFLVVSFQFSVVLSHKNRIRKR